MGYFEDAGAPYVGTGSLQNPIPSSTRDFYVAGGGVATGGGGGGYIAPYIAAAARPQTTAFAYARGALLPAAGTYGTSYLSNEFSMIATSTAEAVATASETVPAFATPTVEEHGFRVDTTNRRIYILGVPRGAICGVIANAVWAANATGDRQVAYYYSGGGNWADTKLATSAALATYCNLFFPIIINTADTYIEMRVLQSSGGNLNLVGAYLAVVRLR